MNGEVESPTDEPPSAVNLVIPVPRAADAAPGRHQGAEVAQLASWQIWLLVAATFGSGMAMIVPMGYSLTVRLDEIAPGRADVLGYLLGIGAAATLVAAPLTGVLSDHTRSRWGRRRPFALVGVLVGLAAIPVMAFAPDPVLLGVGWVLSTVGWNTAGGSLGNWQADRLPPSQRGKVSGMTGLTMQVAPVLGILLVGLVRDETLLIFAIPAALGALTVVIFIIFAKDPDSRSLATAHPLTIRAILRGYAFRPTEFPDFTWNWIGRFAFFLGLTLSTSFSVFFYAQRLDLAIPDVAGVLALTSALSLVTATVGSLGGGWLSDRVGRRKPFLLLGAALVAAGSVVSSVAHDLPALVIGTLTSSLGIAAFSAVGQALSLDVLPHRETQAGRYMAITLFAQKIPGVIAPAVAPLLLGIGGDAQNYFLLYVTAGALSLVGGGIIVLGVRSKT